MSKFNSSQIKSRGRGQRHNMRGQGMMEYIIIVALIAIAAIGTYGVFGQTVRNQSAGLAKELAGRSSAAAVNNANTSSTSAVTRANATKGLSTYNTANDAQ